jgi:hypothetical protein
MFFTAGLRSNFGLLCTRPNCTFLRMKRKERAMRNLRYAYFVTLADGSRHFVVTDRCSDYYTRESFRQQLEDTMREDGEIDAGRISIRNFWYHGEMEPEDLMFSRSGRACAGKLPGAQPGRQ